MLVPTSGYQLAKLWVLRHVPLSKDALHIHVGMLALLFSVVVLRRPLGSWGALVPTLLVSLGMEAFDLRDDVRSLGHMRLGASFKDLVNTNLLPFLVVLLARRRLLKT